MRHAIRKHYWLGSVSFGALDVSLRARASSYDLPAAHGFLARIRLWIQLIFGGPKDVDVRPVTHITAPPRNRHKARLHRRNLPLARRPDSLAHHILRRYGRKAYQNWRNNRTLTPRIAWCFRDWNWLWAPRLSFAGCAAIQTIELSCSAPLKPD